MKNFSSYFLIASMIFLISCNSVAEKIDENPQLTKAQELAHRFIMVDGHVDLPYRMRVEGFRLKKEFLDVGSRTPKGDFDYVRSKKGGLDAPFMSIYIPSELQKTPGKSKELADSLITMVEKIPTRYPDKFAMASSPDEIEQHFKEGKISLPLGMENGSPIETDIANVAHFHQRGIRYITLTHGTDNQICDSSYDTTRTWNGLSPFGEEVVKEMNRVGIMVDVSHISDSAFYDVMALTDVPVIASHSSCRYFTPGFERNMNDDMIRKLGENGGVIMINFGSSFLDSASRKKYDKMYADIGAWAKENNVSQKDSAFDDYVKEYVKEHGAAYSDVKVVADHIDHVVKLAGIGHVGLGSDFDGVGDSLPTGLKDVSEYPNLIMELLKRGYSESDIEKICSKNVFRVWRQVEKMAG